MRIEGIRIECVFNLLWNISHFKDAMHIEQYKITQPHCALYSIKQLFNMAASLAILITLFFQLSIVRLHYTHKIAKIRGTASTRIHNRVLGEYWNSHIHNFVPHNAIKADFVCFVLPKRLEELSSLRWTSQLPSRFQTLQSSSTHVHSSRWTHNVSRELRSGAVPYAHRCSIQFNPLQTTSGSGLSGSGFNPL